MEILDEEVEGGFYYGLFGGAAEVCTALVEEGVIGVGAHGRPHMCV